MREKEDIPSDAEPAPDLSSAERRARWADAVLRDLDRVAQAATTDAWERCAHDGDCACLVVPADQHERVVMSLRADPAGKGPVASDADRTFVETFTPGRVRALVELARRLVARELIDALREPAADERSNAESEPAERAEALGWVPAIARVLRPRRSRHRRFAVSTWTNPRGR